MAPVKLTFSPAFTGMAMLGSTDLIFPEGVSTTQLLVVIWTTGKSVWIS